MFLPNSVAVVAPTWGARREIRPELDDRDQAGEVAPRGL